MRWASKRTHIKQNQVLASRGHNSRSIQITLICTSADLLELNPATAPNGGWRMPGASSGERAVGLRPQAGSRDPGSAISQRIESGGGLLPWAVTAGLAWLLGVSG